jgi:hypothetical protein
MVETLKKSGVEWSLILIVQIQKIGDGANQKWIMTVLDNMLMTIMKLKLLQ